MNFDYSLIDWSRAQFALTAMYHWIFVPITLGITFIIAIMETFYVKTNNPEWKRITKFWMTLFGINFAIGIATGIILEFEFGTNWSNYSWFVGDIFGAPLAIEGIMAFFLESTFIALMFFGWNKLSKRAHLIATWVTAIGTNLSALWILVANGWMQSPVGMKFNPDTARNEMLSFWDVFLSPVAISKFLHTISSSYTLASLFVICVSAWYILRKREISLARKSMVIAAIFGLISSLYTAITGDASAKQVVEKQPMKLAAMEGLYQGKNNAALTAFGFLKDQSNLQKQQYIRDYYLKIEIPNALSLLAFNDPNAFVPGIKDLVEGNASKNLIPLSMKISMGKKAIQALADYRNAIKVNDAPKAINARKALEANFKYFGYGYIKNARQAIPNVALTFYSFHIMVTLGFWFIVFFIVTLFLIYNDKIQESKLWLRLSILGFPLAFIASEAGWIVAELGRQPWVIQDLMPTMAAVSKISAGTVQITFWLFAVVFTALLAAEISIMIKQIKLGPKEGGH
ncbi:MAG: cytochrome ubiquinol oxidase subunit I [Bacteroidota bacterium]|nr:cytochrome ubiquinol oxidase subunit I [Bacteroidota bacterium]